MSRLSDAEARERISFDFARRPYRRPPEMEGRRRRWPVAIVGGGPVGLQMALELERFGVDCVVLHAGDAVSLGSRAICIAGRSLDILQRVGIAEDFRRKGLAWTHGKSYYRSDLVYELEMPDDPRVRHRPMTNLQQYYMEQFAAARAENAAHVDLRWQHRFVDLTRHDDHVVCRVETPDGGYQLEADHLVACDGARSTVRDALGLKLHGTSSTGRYLICDIRMACRRPTERLALFDPPCNPGATMLLHKQPDDTWRLDFQLPDADSAEAELDLERLIPRIESALEMLGETAAWELLWASLYKAHALALDDYRHGRVLFAGDAAHLVPIFGVRGLNSGYADANNLGWKLAAVHRGEADEALLDTYSTERRAATMDILENARKSTAFMTPPSPGYELMRDAALSLAVTEPFARCLVNPRQSRPQDYVDSPLTTPGDDIGGLRPGAPLPDLRLPEGRTGAADYLLDRLADGFNALCLVGDEDAERRYADLAAEMVAATPRCRLLPVVDRADRLAGDPARILDPDRRLAAALGDSGVLLVRPDDHICARLPALDASSLKRALARASLAAGAETA